MSCPPKPPPIPPADPAIYGPVFAAIAALDAERNRLAAIEAMRSPELVECLENAVLAIADPDRPVRREDWELLSAGEQLCRSIRIDAGPAAYDSGVRLTVVAGAVDRLVAAVKVLRDPPAPEMIRPETLKDLIDQGVSDHQIGLILNWKTQTGAPDLNRVRAAKTDEAELRRDRSYWRQPPLHKHQHRPHCGELAWLREMILTEKEREREARAQAARAEEDILVRGVGNR
jgi:hypothetical protein